MAKNGMCSATIVRAKDGTIRIRVARGDPEPVDDGKLIEILYGEDEEELKERAVRFAREQVA